MKSENPRNPSTPTTLGMLEEDAEALNTSETLIEIYCFAIFMQRFKSPPDSCIEHF